MPLYQAVKMTALEGIGTKLKVSYLQFTSGAEEWFAYNSWVRLATKMGSGGSSEISLPNLQIGGSYTEAVEMKIQVGGAWKDLA